MNDSNYTGNHHHSFSLKTSNLPIKNYTSCITFPNFLSFCVKKPKTNCTNKQNVFRSKFYLSFYYFF